MKLLLVTASFPFGPSEAFLDPELPELRARGVDLTILPTLPRGKHRLQGSTLLEGVSLVEVRPFSWHALAGGIGVASRRPLQTLAVARSLVAGSMAKTLKNISVLPLALYLSGSDAMRGIEHIHVHFAGVSGSLAMAIAQLTGVPWSMTCHRWDIYENNLLAAKTRSARFVRFVSERGRDDAVALGAPREKTVVVHMGVTQTVVSPTTTWRAQPGVTFRIVCAANLYPVKGHRYLIEAVRILLDQGMRLRLELVGDGHLRTELEAQVHELGLEETIVFSGFVPHDELLQRYARGEVDLVVLASIELGAGLHEGVPVSLMEAMSYGIPVVATVTGSIEELVPRELCILVSHSNPVEMAAAIHGLYIDSDRYLRIASRCHEIIEMGWTVGASVDDLLGLIRSRQ